MTDPATRPRWTPSPGGGQPPKDPSGQPRSVRVHARVTAELLDAIDAARGSQSRADWLSEAIRAKLAGG